MKKAKLKSAVPQLPTGDIEKTASFFERILGFAVWAKFPEQKHLIVGRGSAEIHFWETESEQLARTLASNSSCYIRVKRIDSLFAELEQNKAPFRFKLTEQPWGMKEMQIDDPYGNAIKFGEPVG